MTTKRKGQAQVIAFPIARESEEERQALRRTRAICVAGTQMTRGYLM
ncbi:MAG: hypothetical protein AABN33_10970 [Acidobacteriota bacterium]